MTADRSGLLCLKPVATVMGERYCTLRVGHESVRFESEPCRYHSTFWRGEWVEACQVCGGPLGMITTEDAQGRIICGACCRDEADARIDAMFAEGLAEGERRRRAQLRRMKPRVGR